MPPEPIELQRFSDVRRQPASARCSAGLKAGPYEDVKRALVDVEAAKERLRARAPPFTLPRQHRKKDCRTNPQEGLHVADTVSPNHAHAGVLARFLDAAGARSSDRIDRRHRSRFERRRAARRHGHHHAAPPCSARASATTTTADGTYRIPLVPPGSYSMIQASWPASAPRRGKNVGVALNQQTTLDFTLASAASPNRCRCRRKRRSLEVAALGRHQHGHPAHDRRAAAERPQLHRPGRARARRQAGPDLTSSTNVEIFGERAGAVSYLVDGAENNDPVNGGALLRYTQDSIKEFEVITTGYAGRVRPRAGRRGEHRHALGHRTCSTGARSGSRATTSSTRTTSRRPVRCRPATSRPKPPKLERYQWGGTLGGPDREGPGVLLRVVREAERDARRQLRPDARSRRSC